MTHAGVMKGLVTKAGFMDKTVTVTVNRLVQDRKTRKVCCFVLSLNTPWSCGRVVMQWYTFFAFIFTRRDLWQGDA
jgi:hypothetical protein